MTVPIAMVFSGDAARGVYRRLMEAVHPGVVDAEGLMELGWTLCVLVVHIHEA